MTIESTTQSEHEELMLKLPWLLNGTLPDTEAASMQSHVAQCDECQSEMASLSLMNKAITEAPYETGNATASLHKMRERIAAEPKYTFRATADRFFAAIGRILPVSPPPQWAIASLGGVLLGFVLLVQTGIMGNNTDDAYGVLTDGTTVNSVAIAISVDTDTIDPQMESVLTEATKLMALDSQLVKASADSYQLTIADPSDDSTIAPERLMQLFETVRAIPGVKAVTIAP